MGAVRARRGAGGRGPLVTLTSDLGATYAAQVKGVVLRRAPTATLIDLTQELPAHRIAEGAFILRHATAPFAAGAIHLAIVDPGVGSPRAAIAVRCRDGTVFLGPDNGLVVEAAADRGIDRSVRIDPARHAPSDRVGATFDGRDLFAPAAAHLANGGAFAALGPAIVPRTIQRPPPVRDADRLRGHVAHIDRFGNLVTDLPSAWLPTGIERLAVRIGRRRAAAVRRIRAYADLPRGPGLGLLPSSFGTVEVCRREGSAATRTGGRVGASVTVTWPERRRRRRKERK